MQNLKSNLVAKSLFVIKFLNLSIAITKPTAIVLGSLIIVACKPAPPDKRPIVTDPLYTLGDAESGKRLYDTHCVQCHKLQPGNNRKGPQLIGVYGAKAGLLSDYKYSQAMAQSNWVWDKVALDKYIADPLAVMPETRMQADPLPNESDRQDIIAYLSTLGRSATP